jgi:Ulp1 family protease
VKILELHKVFIPVHVHGNHWCLAVINLEDKRFEYYDSVQVTPIIIIILTSYSHIPTY